ncbi:hypothetical protein ASPWEDRAFT_159686 [Aspergillus wentii DTO 134E9]|uniref:Uncharacterized protein n=1 Tax=Aspergillus wentii DTO 134E9 TaxID=1073089 RepID=A0A1L9RDZ2_ASPWE|nr:uncharacterized protein ASPWEDRAFT_159686 [Aspergillus wentii DTO 134E9]KAI9933411.1 hypothetical protein MW887_007884 [Aspergillus wentii]OJJ33146.1 hypothetical protein ASPWEDRAFT_159686 [Aspergillus wentii DTO 134E9]
MSISKSESDIILNRANVALARSQRLVASWLPPKTEDELTNIKTEEELQKEEDEIFTAVPETLGVGAPLPQKAADGSWNRTELSSNDKLRKQLLGKNYEKVTKAKALAAKQALNQSAASTQSSTPQEDEDDDEEEGRTALVGRKKNNKKRKVDSNQKEETPGTSDAVNGDNGDGDDEDAKRGAASSSRPSAKGRKKATSFLDEILAQRSKKRKK